MSGGVKGFRTLQVTFCSPDRILRALASRVCSLHLRVKFRNLEHGEHLPGLDAVANVHINLADVSGNFGMDIDLLERPEVPGQGDGVSNRLTLHHDHGSRGRSGFRGWTGVRFAS